MGTIKILFVVNVVSNGMIGTSNRKIKESKMGYLTLAIILQIKVFCQPYTYEEPDCENEVIQCMTDDVFTLKECGDEYLVGYGW